MSNGAPHDRTFEVQHEIAEFSSKSMENSPDLAHSSPG